MWNILGILSDEKRCDVIVFALVFCTFDNEITWLISAMLTSILKSSSVVLEQRKENSKKILWMPVCGTKFIFGCTTDLNLEGQFHIICSLFLQ